VAAGITFFVLLAIFPAISAFVSVYGLVASGDDARSLIANLGWILPGGAVSVIGQDVTRLTQVEHTKLGVNFMVSLVISLWSANAGAKAMFDGLNVAYEVHEKRSFVRLNLISLAVTLGLVLVAVVLAACALVVPPILARLGDGELAALALLRWPLALAVAAGALSGLYCIGPSRRGRCRWMTPGATVAAVAWIAASIVFSLCVARFGQFDRTYGTLGDVFGFMTWIWISTTVVLFGAELNAEAEKAGGRKAGDGAYDDAGRPAGDDGPGSSALGSAPRTSAQRSTSAFTGP
jgi:membrane protein